MIRTCSCFLLLFLCSPLNSALAKISLAGTSGLINIPTADVIEDRKVTVGFGVVNRNSAYLQPGESDNFPFYIVIGYLPRLEFSAGVTFVPGKPSYDGTNTYKDGVVSLQYLVMRENHLFPSVAIGARDIYSYILLNTTFIVASKTVVRGIKSHLRIHFGYGSDVIDRHLGVPESDQDNPVGHTVIGWFGGMEFKLNNSLLYMMEYDSKKINSGFRLQLNPYLYVDIAALNMEDWSGSFNISFNL